MRPQSLLLTVFGIFLFALFLPLHGQTVADYQFMVGTGTPTDMSSGTTTIIANNVDDGSSGIQNIGFTFRFANVDYTQFSVSSNGAMRLGSATVATTFSNSLTTTLPMIASFFEDMHTGVYDANGYVKMKVSGSAPSRVLTLEWRARAYSSNLGNSSEIFNWQIRLYESTNIIEFLYMTMRSDLSTTATIGIANSAAANDFISVTPGSPPTISRTAINNSANISGATNALTTNRLFTFAPCNGNITVSGNVAQGGTAGMANGDTLLRNTTLLRGSSSAATPLNITLPAPACAPRTYTYSVSGTNAADYIVSPATGTINSGQTLTPTVTFRPTGTGLRDARLTVTDNNGFSRTYVLSARGLTRIKWIGNIAQGGTQNVASGDTLVYGFKVPYGTSKTFTPLTLENFNVDPLASPPANITYTLNDPTGNYSITPASTSLNGGLQSTPQITFNANGDVGFQDATLTVNAEGEIRTYILHAFNAAPGGELYVGADRVSRGNPLFVDRNGCVGVDIVTLEVEARNTGAGNFVIRGADIYSNDTVVGQGSYPLLRDLGGQPIRSIDYFLTFTPGVVPKANNTHFDSLVIPEGEKRTFYVNFIPTRPGKRFGTIYFNTNAFNTSDPNVNGVPTRGVLQAGVFGRGNNAYLSNATSTGRPEPLVFATTDVRETGMMTARLTNNGACDLRISRSKLRIESGDVNEFKLVTVLPNTPVSGDDYLLAPGFSDSVVVSFSPETYGSRRATIHLATNDSTLGTETGAERGVYYWDVFGVGRVGLEVRGVRLNPAVIGAETSRGFVTLENTSGGIAEIESLTLEGGNGEIIADGSHAWPSLPILLKPGEKLQLWVELKPGSAATPGDRTAEVVIKLKGGAESRAVVKGYVGTRRIAVLPGSLFMNAQVKVGEYSRQFVTITNIGTLPLRLQDAVLGGTNVGNYRVSELHRRVLEPGQTELLEVTYTPQGSGVSSGTLTVQSDGTNGSQVVLLGGTGTGTQIGGPGNAGTGTSGSLSGSGKVWAESRLWLGEVAPNPVRGEFSLGYGAGGEGDVSIVLYDMSGRQVSARHIGTPGPAEQSVTFEVGELPSGTYHCVITQGEQSVSRTVYVVK